jgi:hypothetical protein
MVWGAGLIPGVNKTVSGLWRGQEPETHGGRQLCFEQRPGQASPTGDP